MTQLRGERTQTVPLPPGARSLLGRLGSFLGRHNAVLAGGWVRDHLLGVPGNDVDLWVPRMPFDALDGPVLAAFLEDHGAVSRTLFRAAQVKAGELARTNWVRQITLPGEPGIELISTWEAPGHGFLERVACKFHVGLCRCGAAFEAGQAAGSDPVVYVSEDFMRDVLEHTLTFFGDYEGKHHEKMLARYPDREFIYPSDADEEQDLGWVGSGLHGSSGGY